VEIALNRRGRIMKYVWLEEYHCGCATEETRKRDLPGYCPKHGEDAIRVYKIPYKMWKAVEDEMEEAERDEEKEVN
jgi:hypothetical protein